MELNIRMEKIGIGLRLRKDVLERIDKICNNKMIDRSEFIRIIISNKVNEIM